MAKASHKNIHKKQCAILTFCLFFNLSLYGFWMCHPKLFFLVSNVSFRIDTIERMKWMNEWMNEMAKFFKKNFNYNHFIIIIIFLKKVKMYSYFGLNVTFFFKKKTFLIKTDRKRWWFSCCCWFPFVILLFEINSVQ